MKINRLNLISSLNKVLPGVAVGNVVIENADTIVFNKGHIYSYNAAISVDAKLPDGVSLTGVVKGKDFYNTLSKLPNDEIEIEMTDSTWEIKDGKIKVSIKLLPVGDLIKRFESHSPSEEWSEIDGSDFNKALKVCTIKGNTSSFPGIIFKDSAAYSTNKCIINKYCLKNSYPTFWISDKTVNELGKWNNFVKVQFDKLWVHFMSDDGVIFSVRALNVTDYPLAKVSGLLEKDNGNNKAFSIVLDSAFYNGIDRASEFSNCIDEHETVEVEFGKEVKIRSSRDSGNYEEIVEGISVDIPNPKKMNFDYADFISSEKFFNTLEVISDTPDFDDTKPVHCILKADSAVKLFSSIR